MLVVNWINKVKKFYNIFLCSLYEDVNQIMDNFDSVSCRHVYKEKNSVVDELS